MKEKVQETNTKEHTKSQAKKSQQNGGDNDKPVSKSKGGWRAGNFEESPLPGSEQQSLTSFPEPSQQPKYGANIANV